MKRNEEIRCCICGNVIHGYGNNPWPVKEHGRCCDDCDSLYVIPMRLAAFFKRAEERREK